jgi:DNA-binding MarR family transcriptional regulator
VKAPASLTTQLYRVEQHRRALTSEVLAVSQLTLAQWMALSTLAHGGATSMTELAKASASDRTSLTRTIDSLIPRSLVVRYTPPTNRRVVMVEATPEGISQVEDIGQRLATLEQYWLEGLSPAEQQGFSEALDRILTALQGSDPTRPT